MQYRVYDVTTKENTTLGIKAGSKSELQASGFHELYERRHVHAGMPEQTFSKDIVTNFQMYDAMLETVREHFVSTEYWENLKTELNIIN